MKKLYDYFRNDYGNITIISNTIFIVFENETLITIYGFHFNDTII